MIGARSTCKAAVVSEDPSLTRYFAELAGRLLAVEGVQETMAVIVAAAVEAIDGCDHASLSYKKGAALVSAASNDDIGIMLDGIQTGAQQGPCIDAIRLGEVTVVANLEADTRWPVYGPRAVEATGIVSAMAYPLQDGKRTVGALNLFAERPGAFGGDVEQESVISILVAHSVPALVAALDRANLKEALQRRDVIGQAKGMLMARSNVDADRAFEMLVSASQRTNVKLAEVARRLVSGSLGDSSTPPPA
jgi:transcriptional regulator with GAF, ATPase, and Fis domain